MIVMDLWEFTCPVCHRTLRRSKPFPLQYCPFCALDIKAYNEECNRKQHYSDVARRDTLKLIADKFPLTEEEKDAIDYAMLLIQNEIDGEVE